MWLKKVLSDFNERGFDMEEGKKSFDCPYCPVDDRPHMIVILDKNGDIHVHAPFGNRYLMNEFLGAIDLEQEKFNQK